MRWITTSLGLAAVIFVAMNARDIQRYWRISTM